MRLNEVPTYGIAVLNNNEVVFIFKDHDDINHKDKAGVRYLHNTGRNHHATKHIEQQVLLFGAQHGGIDFGEEVIQFWPLEPNEALEYEEAIRRAVK